MSPMGQPTFCEMNIELAIDKIRGDTDGDICDFVVSCDGTWKRRGYASLILTDLLQ